MYYTTCKIMKKTRQEQLVNEHNKRPFNNMTNEEYKEYLKQEWTSSILFSTDSEVKALEHLEKDIKDYERRNNGYKITKVVQVDCQDNILKILKIF